MRVNVIPTHSLDSFNYFVFPEQNQLNKSYFQSQVQNISNTLNGLGKGFMETTKQIYETINDSVAIKKAMAALQYVKNALHPNQITALSSLDELRGASLVMQRYIMADIVTRQMYQDLKIDGYSDTYVDAEPDKIGLRHYDYRRVIDSVVQDVIDEDGNLNWKVINIAEELYDGDRDLTIKEKANILSTWEVINLFMKSGADDPTDVWGGKVV